MGAMAEWRAKSGWGRTGSVLDVVSVIILVCGLGYAMLRGVQIPEWTWPSAFVLFAFGRALREADLSLRRRLPGARSAEGDE